MVPNTPLSIFFTLAVFQNISCIFQVPQPVEEASKNQIGNGTELKPSLKSKTRFREPEEEYQPTGAVTIKGSYISKQLQTFHLSTKQFDHLVLVF